MQWDEDTWIDISDPPSPVQGETRKTPRNGTVDHLQESEQDFAGEVYHSNDVSFDDSCRNEELDLNGSWRLPSHIEPGISEAYIQDVSDLHDLHKLAQELLESYQEFATIAHNSDNSSEKKDSQQIINLPLDAISNDRSIHLTSSTSEHKSFKAESLCAKKSGVSQINRHINSTRTFSRKKSRDKSTSSNRKTKEKQTANVNISTKVPHSLCKNKTNGYQKRPTQNTSTSIKPRSVQTPVRRSASCDSLSEVSEHIYDLYEYRKLKIPTRSKALARYSILNNNSSSNSNSNNNNNKDFYYYQHSTTRNLYNELYDEEEEDKAKAIVCVLFCLMGVGLIIGLVCLLSHYVEETELGQMAVSKDDENNPDIMIDVYYRRVADIIRLASQTASSQGANTSSTPTGESLKLCQLVPGNLLGNTTQLILNVTLDIEEVVVNNTDVMDGGEWKPRTCAPRHRVAIVIPYRDRWNHLKVLLYYLIPTLKRQQIHFRIFVVEQYGNETFNKGRIMNAAFREALKLFDFHCVTFHDVDLVPEDDRNMYTCTEQPKHMSNSIDKFKYILPYQGLVGGVLMFKREHFQLVNGYSNMYWGWGAEDDDMTTRILSHGLRIYRTPSNIAKYKMVKHDGRKSSEVSIRMRLLRSAAKRSKLEGLNNVKYKLLETHIQKLFTHFIVDIGKP